MRLTPVAKFTLLFSACFSCALLLAVYAVTSGWLSPRGFAAAVSLACVTGFATCVVAMFKIGRKEITVRERNPVVLDEVTRKRRIRSIRFYKAGIAFLVLCLVMGLVNAKNAHAPLLPTLVGVVMNLLFTVGLVVAVRNLQRTLQ